MILALITSPLSFSGFAFAQEESFGLSDTVETELENPDEEEDEIELNGILTDNDDGTFDLETEDGTETISTDENTVIDNGLSLSDLNGLEVDVDAVLIDGVLFATEIELEEEDEVEEESFGDKTTICHIPPGNPGKAHIITVGTPALAAHLAHGDNLDSCNLGLQVSNFVHESRILFEEQEKETKDVIAQCRVNMQNAEPSDRKSAREDCKSNLKDIRESYKSVREIYRETYKAFREDMKVFVQESKGFSIDDSTRDAAIANIVSLSNSAENTELQQNIDEEVTVDKHKLREQMKKDREMAREAAKDLREATEDAAEDEVEAAEDELEAAEKQQRESDRSAEKQQRESDRAAEKQQRESDREAKKQQRESEKDKKHDDDDDDD